MMRPTKAGLAKLHPIPPNSCLVTTMATNAPMTAITLAAVQIGVGIVLSSATNGYNEGVWPGIYYSIGCGGGLILADFIPFQAVYWVMAAAMLPGLMTTLFCVEPLVAAGSPRTLREAVVQPFAPPS